VNLGKLVHDQQWFADGCVAAVSTGHQGSDNQLPDVEAFAAPRKCDRVPVRVQSAWNGQGCAPNIAARTGQHSFRTRAGVQTIRPITLGSRGSGQPANTPKSNTRVHQSAGSRPQASPPESCWQAACRDVSAPAIITLRPRKLRHSQIRPDYTTLLQPCRHRSAAKKKNAAAGKESGKPSGGYPQLSDRVQGLHRTDRRPAFRPPATANPV
jgi:hypothetical protein